MRNLVFQFSLLFMVCFASGIAERSANGYFYDIPKGAPFNIPSKISNLEPIYSPQLGQKLSSGNQIIEILPATLVFQDTQLVNEPFAFNFQQQQQQQHVLSQQNSNRYPVELQQMAFNFLDGSANSGRQNVGPGVVVAQLNPHLMRLANGRPITRIIKTCDANNNCKSVTLQSDPNQRTSGASIAAHAQPNLNQYLSNQVQPRAFNANIYSQLQRPPNRRLIEYTEIEREDPYN